LSEFGEFEGFAAGRRRVRAGVFPGGQHVGVDAADHQGEEDGLGDAAVGKSLFGVGDVDVVAFDSAVQSFDVGPAGTVGAL
jgi:hypothetical protein